MATRCFGRAGLAAAEILPLLFSLRRAVDLAGALRAGDVFFAAFLLAARAAGFFDFDLAIGALPFVWRAMFITKESSQGGQSATCPPSNGAAGRGGHGALRLCPPQESADLVAP